jgi:hypothetical protein
MIYLLAAIVFPPGGSGRSICTKVGKGQQYTEGGTLRKTTQKHRICKTENKHTAEEHKNKNNY